MFGRVLVVASFALSVSLPAHAWTFTTVDANAGAPALHVSGRSLAMAIGWNDYGYGPVQFADVAYYRTPEADLRVRSRLSNGSWKETIVDAVGDVGTYPAIAHDADGGATILYGTGAGDRKMARWHGSGGNCGAGLWWCQALSGGDPLQAIAVDYTDGRRHAVYSDVRGWPEYPEDSWRITYARTSGACAPGADCNWSYSQSIAIADGVANGVVTGRVQLQLQTGGPGVATIPHVAWVGRAQAFALGGDKANWAMRVGGVWYREVIPNTTEADDMDLELDYQDTPRVCVMICPLFDLDKCALRYAKRTGQNAWSVTTVDSFVARPPTSQTNPTCSISSLGNTSYISYDDGGDLRLASQTGANGAWVTAAVETANETGFFSALSVTQPFGLRIAYYDFQLGDLRSAAQP